VNSQHEKLKTRNLYDIRSGDNRGVPLTNSDAVEAAHSNCVPLYVLSSR